MILLHLNRLNKLNFAEKTKKMRKSYKAILLLIIFINTLFVEKELICQTNYKQSQIFSENNSLTYSNNPFNSDNNTQKYTHHTFETDYIYDWKYSSKLSDSNTGKTKNLTKEKIKNKNNQNTESELFGSLPDPTMILANSSGCNISTTATGEATICAGNSVNLNAVGSQTGSYSQSTTVSGYDTDPLWAYVPFSSGVTGATITEISFTVSGLAACTSWYEGDLYIDGTYYSTYCNSTNSYTGFNGTSATTGHYFGLQSYDNDSYSDNISMGLSVTVSWTNSTFSYAWSPTTGLSNPNIANPVATPSSTTTYTVTATSADGCTATNSVTVYVTPYPTNDNCANAVNISSLPYTSSVQSNNCATNDQINTESSCGSHAANIWYKVTGTGNLMEANTCDANTNFDTEIHVYSGSCGSLTEVICNDDDAGCGSNRSKTSWCSTNGTVYYISVGHYYSLTYGNFVLNVIDYPLGAPTGISASSTPICRGNSSTLSANPGTNGDQVYWYTGSCGGTEIGNGTSISVSPTTTTTYYARTKNSTCGNFSSSCASVTVNVDQPTVAGSITQTPSSDGTVCSGNNVNYSYSGGTGAFQYYEYQWNGTGGSWSGSWIASNPSNWTSSLNGASVLYVRANVKNGVCPETTTSPVNITVLSTENNPGEISVPASICAGTATNISNVTAATTGTPASAGPTYYYYWSRTSAPATGYTNYATSTASSYALPSDVINTPGTYLLARNSAFSCTGQANNVTTVNIPLTVYALPSISSVSAAANPICATNTTTLMANGVGGTGATVTWWSGSGGTGTNYGTGTTLVVGTGTYYARVTGTCSPAVEASITVNSKTNVGITSATAAASPICATATTNITANGVTGTGAVLTWWTGTGGTGTNLGSSNPLNVGPGTYYARVTGDCGGPVEASVTVASSKTNVGITSATAAASPICATATTNITANGVTGTGAVLTWWTGTGGTGTNLGSSNPLNVGPGTYYARVTGDCGGSVEASVTVASKTNVGITSATAAASPICRQRVQCHCYNEYYCKRGYRNRCSVNLVDIEQVAPVLI